MLIKVVELTIDAHNSFTIRLDAVVCVVLGGGFFSTSLFLLSYSMSVIFIWLYKIISKRITSFFYNQHLLFSLRGVAVRWNSGTPWGTLSRCIHKTIATTPSPSTQTTHSWHKPHQHILRYCSTAGNFSSVCGMKSNRCSATCWWNNRCIVTV